MEMQATFTRLKVLASTRRPERLVFRLELLAGHR
jgi:hypothetical protein